jgi:hypothetical protein
MAATASKNSSKPNPSSCKPVVDLSIAGPSEVSWLRSPADEGRGWSCFENEMDDSSARRRRVDRAQSWLLGNRQDGQRLGNEWRKWRLPGSRRKREPTTCLERVRFRERAVCPDRCRVRTHGMFAGIRGILEPGTLRREVRVTTQPCRETAVVELDLRAPPLFSFQGSIGEVRFGKGRGYAAIPVSCSCWWWSRQGSFMVSMLVRPGGSPGWTGL